jgi:hypothetical protein
MSSDMATPMAAKRTINTRTGSLATRVLPALALGLGFALTVGWVSLLGFGIVSLMEFAL